MDFQQYFQSKENMPALHPSSLRFLFRFPGKVEYEWHKYPKIDWPFEANNIDYCMEERRLSFVTYYFSKLPSPRKKYSLFIFTRTPLPYHRNVHNHSFAIKPKQEPSTSSITWTCDHITSSQEIFDVLSKFKTTKKLKIFRWKGTKKQNAAAKLIDISPDYFNQFRLNELRSLTFSLMNDFLLESQQRTFLQVILSAAPNLIELTVDWNHVMSVDSVFASGHFIVSPLLNLRRLHLYHNDTDEPLSLAEINNISLLSKSCPRLVSLWTIGCGLHPDEPLAQLIILFVNYFEDLVEIIINKGSTYRRNGIRGLDMLLSQQESINNSLRNTPKLRDSNRAAIIWNKYTQLKIWL